MKKALILLLALFTTATSFAQLSSSERVLVELDEFLAERGIELILDETAEPSMFPDQARVVRKCITSLEEEGVEFQIKAVRLQVERNFPKASELSIGSIGEYFGPNVPEAIDQCRSTITRQFQK